MTTRIYSHKHQLYTNSPLWPSNQLTCSEWALSPKGDVIEIIYGDDSGFFTLASHDKRNFAVEPWTGFFDSTGKKIYLGDIIKLQCFNLDYEIVWYIDRFGMKPLESLDSDNPTPHHIRGQKDFSVDWRVVNNVHNVEYSD